MRLNVTSVGRGSQFAVRGLCIATLAALALTPAAGNGASVEIKAIDGRTLTPFQPAGAAGVIFFVATDCPISNTYAPEIQRVCRAYASRGVGCTLMYEDVDIEDTGGSGARGLGRSGNRLDAAVRAHLREYRYSGIDAAIDRRRTVATHAKASITPQAVVVDRRGEVRYRGRIDNFYAALGKPRQTVTAHDLRDALDDLLAGRPIKHPETQALGCHIVGPDFLRQ
jgi:hypothetical protein